eukprot:TRINITY_DN9460_c0_g1_i1.p1 TRINITY_DN9460_c0_g1~~TRINITY_DN9460_c0_g1_i1.p1  ORF type:complete len:582 (-),score=59.45 TRINITY_DN9460_c0_g1_i1:55-1800(-)
MFRHSYLLIVLVLCCCSWTDAKARSFKQGEILPFYVNTIGPYSNPMESYRYYSIPVCAPDSDYLKPDRHSTLGEGLEGDFYRNALYELKFKEDEEDKRLCTKTFDAEDIATLRSAMLQYYFFELICDDLPVHGFIGTVDTLDGQQTYLFTHFHFNVLYNEDKVIHVNVTSDLRKVYELREGQTEAKISYTYSVKFYPSSIPYEERHYISSKFFESEMEIHWISIMNSFVLVVLLTGFIAIIIRRVLNKDYTRYNDEEQEDDYGWKLIHGDVFRFPPHLSLFCAYVGTGAQFLCISIGLLLLALVGMFYPGSHGSLYTAAILLYAFTSVVAGIVSANFFNRMGGVKWHWNIVLTASLFCAPFIGVFSFVNTVASVSHVTTAIPGWAIVTVLFLWIFVGMPLTIFGGIAGRRMSDGNFEAPCRTKKVVREIPSIPWYRQAPVQMIMAGFLPFSAIYIELYYIYTSVWGHNSYTLYGILFLVFVILIIVTACINIALTYFQLSMEDHRWWWRSFFCGGSTGLFIYLYSFFYFLYRSNMHGFLQLSFYFGYMWIVCYFFFIMLGTVGFYSSLVFVRNIYKNVHVD